MDKKDIIQLAYNEATAQGVDPALALGVFEHESGFKPTARNPKSGASGISQLMPETAKTLGVKNSFDPVQNIKAGVKYLGDLMLKHQGDTNKVLAEYGGFKKKDPSKYIASVQSNAQKYADIVPKDDLPDTSDIVPSSDLPTSIGKKTKTEQINVPKWGMEHPNLYGIAGAAKSALSPLLGAVGLAGGGLVGSSAGPVGTVAGAGLGYAGARRLETGLGQLLGEMTPETIPQAFIGTAKDVASGAEMEMGGQIAGKALGSALNKIRPAKMYERVAKFSTAIKPEERARRVATALKEDIPLSQEGLAKSKQIIEDINNRISQHIQANSETPIDMAAVVQKAGQRMTSTAAQQTAPFQKEPLKQVAGTVREFAQGASQAPQTLALAQQYKVNINRELNDFYKALQSSPDKTTQLSRLWVPKTKAALADELRTEMYNAFPELGQMNAKEASLIQLNKSLERAVNRISNRDLWSLKNIAAFIKHPKWALLEHTMNNPEVQSKLAIAINKAQQSGVVPKVAETAAKVIGVESNKKKWKTLGEDNGPQQ